MKKQIMSIAAIAAIMSTSAIAFDATRGSGQLMKETGATTAVVGNYTDDNKPALAAVPLIQGTPGMVGDALIYPAFFGGNNFETEFSVINTSNDEAVIAKVVLYSAKDSKELRDFNIYLSSNDVFRATIKDGKITSTDGSTVVVGSDSLSAEKDHGYNYKDSSTMASESNPFITTVDENIGYIAVFAMVQADKTRTHEDMDAGYHKKHNKLWRDYRHLLDQCRSENWRSGLENGIYTGGNVNQPNINFADATILSELPSNSAGNNCDILSNSVQNSKTTKKEVAFKSPHYTLTGTLTVSGSDDKGTRSMVIKPIPYGNFSEGQKTVLWTEGELASIADRCIEFEAAGGTRANYNSQCILDDVNASRIDGTLYEFGSLESKLLVTQPWKRTVIQMNGDGDNTLSAVAGTWSGVSRQSKKNGISAGADGKDYNVKNYGGFGITQTVYNDDEDRYIGSAGGFTVSPASTATAGTIPNEMSMFDPLPGGANYPKGYAIIKYQGNLHGIVTQMTANKVDDTAEINWLYPYTTRD